MKELIYDAESTVSSIMTSLQSAGLQPYDFNMTDVKRRELRVIVEQIFQTIARNYEEAKKEQSGDFASTILGVVEGKVSLENVPLDVLDRAVELIGLAAIAKAKQEIKDTPVKDLVCTCNGIGGHIHGCPMWCTP